MSGFRMMKTAIATLMFVLSGFAYGQSAGGVSAPDPFILGDPNKVVAGYPGNGAVDYGDTNGRSFRNTAPDPTKKTLVLIVAGQSNWTTVVPTFYTATNTANIDNMNIFDGALYSITGPLLGSSQYTVNNGNISVRVADTLITNGKFDRVILVPIAVGSSTIADWTTGGLSNRPTVAMKRLAARGITPGMTGVTFAFLWGQGEGDAATTQANYAAGLTSLISATNAAGFSGRYFICKETWSAGAAASAVQAAQVAAVNGTTVFSGGNLDALTGANRQADNTHFSDAGAAAVASAVVSAMAVSGAPF
jgi:hypothetical protein